MAVRLPSLLAAVAVAAALRSAYGFVATSRPTRHTAPASAALSASAGESPYALLFDCDGVIIETEELHRLAAEGISVLVSTHYMDEAERCHKLAYIAYGELLAQGTADEVIASQHLSTWSVSGGNLVELGRKLEGQPGVDQTVAFGSVLHVTGADAQALEGTLRKLAGESSMRAEPIDTGLEDVFIHMMKRFSDNYGAQP